MPAHAPGAFLQVERHGGQRHAVRRLGLRPAGRAIERAPPGARVVPNVLVHGRPVTLFATAESVIARGVTVSRDVQHEEMRS